MVSLSIKIIGSELFIEKFKGYLNNCGISIKIGLRSGSSNDKSVLHLIVNFSSVSVFSSLINSWFVDNGNSLIISGDKDAMGLSEMDEITFSHSDSLSSVRKKVDELVDRQLFYESFGKRNFRKSKDLLG